MSTSLDRNIDSLANIIMQRRQMQAQQAQQDRANRLSDLQFKQLQREDDYQTGLRNAMTNPGGSGVTLPQLQPQQPQQNTLASLAPRNHLPFPQPQASFAPVEAKMSPSRAGAEYALGQGKIEDAVKLFSVDDHVAQLRAKGDLQGYYEAQRELEEGSKFFDVVNKFKAHPQQLTALWPQIQRMFPQQSEGITPDSIKFNSDYTVLPLVMDGKTIPGKGILRDGEGKTSIIDTTPKEQGKPFAREYDEGDTRVTELYDASGKLTSTKKAPRYKPAAPGAGPDAKGDLEERKIALKELPALRKDAESAKQAYPRINRMLQIIDSGNAGGVSATLKQWLAPYAPESKSMNEAALFQTFARMVSGPQRVNIIGTGPQTEAEGRLLATVGGGGTQGRAALRELLNMHKEGYIAKRDEYNQMLANAKTKIYKPINFGDSPAPMVPPPAGGKDKRPPLSAIFGTKKR